MLLAARGAAEQNVYHLIDSVIILSTFLCKTVQTINKRIQNDPIRFLSIKPVIIGILSILCFDFQNVYYYRTGGNKRESRTLLLILYSNFLRVLSVLFFSRTIRYTEFVMHKKSYVPKTHLDKEKKKCDISGLSGRDFRLYTDESAAAPSIHYDSQYRTAGPLTQYQLVRVCARVKAYLRARYIIYIYRYYVQV
jgi:hypothetical protein